MESGRSRDARREWQSRGRRRHRRIVFGLIALVVVLVVGAALGLLGYRDARRARIALETARSELLGTSDNPTALSSADGRAAAQARLRSAAASVATGRHALHHSLAFTAARFVPVVNHQRNALFQLVDDAQIAVATGNDVLAQISKSADALHIRQGAIPLAEVRTLGATARTSGKQLSTLIRPSSGLWGQLRDARDKFNILDSHIADRLNTGGDDLAAASTFLGSTGDRNYFLALENNAEIRDRGMTLSYGTIAMTAGHLSVDHTGPIAEVALQAPTATPVPPGTAKVFSEIAPTLLFQSTTATPDFAFSGHAMADMFHQATGRYVDGAVAVDVPGLASLLAIVGPVTVPGVPTPISSTNAGTVLLHDLYALDPGPDQAERKEHLGDVARAVIDKITQGDVDTVSLARTLATAAAGGHIKLFSNYPTEEAAFERSSLGGGPALVNPDRTFHIAVESRLAVKVDYYVQPSIAQHVALNADGSAAVHTVVTVDNTAPAGPGPSYQLGPDTSNPYPGQAPGDYIAWVLCWGPQGSSQKDSVTESGLQVTAEVPLLHAGEKKALEFDTIIPHAVRDGRLELRYVPQPRLTPDDLTVTVDAPGWSLTGLAPTFHSSLDRTINLSWGASRG